MNFSIFSKLKELINSKCLAILKLGVSSKNSLDYSMIHCITDRLRRHMRVLKNNNIPSANIYLDHRMIEERSYEFRKVKFKRIALNTNLYKI